ncbi:general stress protein [Bacillus sp. ISL-47]|uniref:general stress protein n=1 Tax=Bacillus sp. ISL-47 TaxID=2819130 RepID=UPI001BE62B4C|nr:general stress protein [Bacillus sp. ISL-47]MBT2687682.1 general stress protein [Bacillus sp. ISL-47]MBT2707443.1 general stress protein [Pseudomonas sp. ISL-84]
MATSKHIVGAYDTEQEAIQAVEKLRSEGYRPEDISVISKNQEDVDAVTEETGTKTEEGLATGAATGGVLGGLTGLLAGVGALAIPGIGPIVAAGPIAATLTGAAVGAGAGGIAGALIGMGIPEEEAHRYEADVKSGKILVLVDPETRSADFNDGYTGTDRTTLEGDRTTYTNVDPLNPGELDHGTNAFKDNTRNSSSLWTDDNLDSNRPLSENLGDTTADDFTDRTVSGYNDEVDVRRRDAYDFDNVRENRDNPYKG